MDFLHFNNSLNLLKKVPNLLRVHLLFQHILFNFLIVFIYIHYRSDRINFSHAHSWHLLLFYLTNKLFLCDFFVKMYRVVFITESLIQKYIFFSISNGESKH